MNAELGLLAILALPVAQAALVLACARPPGLRDAAYVLAASASAGVAFFVFNEAAHGEQARVVLARPLPNVDLAFALEPLGAMMALAISGLGLLHAIHSAGFVRATQEKSPARLMAFMSLTSACALAVAFSANLFTMFVAMQALTLAAFPLVEHRGDEEAGRAGRLFLAVLLASSIGLFLPAMVWTYAIAGVLDFRPGGVLGGLADPVSANVLLLMFVFGIAAAAIPPMHRWLTASRAAPFPALVSLHALTVLPAGCIGVFKVSAFVFGASGLQDAHLAASGLIVLAGAAMCAAALIALSKQDVRERLTYSCMAQSLAAVLGALLALPAGLFAAALQITALMCSAATLLMASGTIAAVTGRTQAGEYAGLGRIMPWTLAGFALASASMVGMPPFAGAWAKLWLIASSSSVGLVWAAVLIGLAAILTFAHLGPMAASALSARAPPDAFIRPDGASFMLVAPVALGAVATLSLLIFASALSEFLSPIWTPPP